MRSACVITALAVVFSLSAAVAPLFAQGTNTIPIALVAPGDISPPPDPIPQSLVITDPTEASVSTTEAVVSIRGTATADIVTSTVCGLGKLDWVNTLTSGTGCATLVDGVWETTVPVTNVKVSDTFTEQVSVNLTAHTPDTGTRWDLLISEAGANWYCEARSSDYVQPNSSDSGTNKLICEAIPASAISGVNYNLSWAQHSTYASSSTSGASLVFGITGTNDYCVLEILNSTQNPDVILAKVVAGTPTTLGSANLAPANGNVWRVERRGNAFTVLQDGVIRIAAVTDAACAGSTRTGGGFGDVRPGSGKNIASGTHMDDFLLEDPDAGGGVTGISLDIGTNVITFEGCHGNGTPCYTDIVTYVRGGSDTVAPTGTITAPTSLSTYSTSVAALPLGGTYADLGGAVQSVVVGCAECTPTSLTASLANGSWSTTDFTQAVGDNNFIVTITDTSSNVTVLPTLVSTLAASADVTPPTISITGPNSGGSSTETLAAQTLSGVAADNVALAVPAVTWAGTTCGSGNASGSSTWTVNLTLTLDCTVTVTARDTAGLTTTDSHVYTFTPPLVIITTSLAPETEDLAGQTRCVTATGGTAPFVWDVSAGTLPAGQALDGSVTRTVCITGTPTTSQTANFTLRITDSAGTPLVDTQALSIVVSSGTLGGTNHDNFNTWCARIDMYKCVSFRETTGPNSHAAYSGWLGDNAENSFIATRSGLPTWSYAPGSDADAQKQDASKYRKHPWTQFLTPASGKHIAVDPGVVAAGTIQAITFDNTVALQLGRAIIVDDEIMVCFPPTAGTPCITNATQAWMMRGTYGTTVAAHAIGATVYTTTAGNVDQLKVPVNLSGTTNDTYLASIDVYATTSLGGQGNGLGTSMCGGIFNNMTHGNTVCAQAGGGWKGFQFYDKGGAIFLETKLSTLTPEVLRPVGWSFTDPTHVTNVHLRYYSVVGPPFAGTHPVAPVVQRADAYVRSFIWKVAKWTRIFWLLELNTDQNLASYGRMTDITTALAADTSDTIVELDYSALPPAVPGGLGGSHVLWGASAGQGTRRIRVGSELMSITVGNWTQVAGAFISAADCKASGTCGGCTYSGSPTPVLMCKVIRAVDGTSIATHAIGADLELSWDYYSMYFADEDHDPVLIYDRIPIHVRTNGGGANANAIAQWVMEFDDSEFRVIQHVADIGFTDQHMYMRDFAMLKKAGTTGGFGGGTLPAEWSALMIKPTVGGN